MNEIEKAIKHFEGLSKRYTTQHNGKHCEFVKTALAALYEKQEREIGCEYCNTKHEDWSTGGAHDFRIHEGAIYYYDRMFGWEGMTINLCPMCGRSLKEKHNDQT